LRRAVLAEVNLDFVERVAFGDKLRARRAADGIDVRRLGPIASDDAIESPARARMLADESF
jgi:hypothetical protein